MKLPKNLNPLYDPYGQFQIDTIGFGVIKPNAGLLLPVGKGKTYCAINICKWRIENSGVKKTLILCPVSVMEKWQDEIMKFSGDNSIIIHNSSRNKRIKLLNTFNHSNIKYGITNYEGLHPYFDHFQKINIDMMIADESSRYIKNIVSGQRDRAGRLKPVKRSNATVLLGDKAKYRLILTANLINKPNDIWTQFRFLDKGKTFGDNYWAWRNYYFSQEDLGFYKKWVLKEDKIQQLRDKIYSICIYFDKKDIESDVPEAIYQTIPITMDRSLRKVYEQIRLKVKSEIETEQGNTTLNIKHIFTKLIRCQQVTSGYIKDESGDIKDLKQKPKLKALLEEIETILDSEESAVVWCRFRYTIKLIENMLKKNKINYLVMHGGTKNKGSVWKDFQKSKTINVFVGQVEAGGIGIELFKLNSNADYQHVLFMENVFGLDPRNQAIGRVEQRIGQTAKCRVVDFIVKDSIDEKIYNSIIKDEEVALSIMRDGITSWL